MKRIRLLTALVLSIMLLAGCYEINLQIKVLETGRTLLAHNVVLQNTMFQMRLSELKLSPTQVRNEVRRLADQDAATLSHVQVAGVSVIAEKDNTLISRQFLFDDSASLVKYLELLGLTANLQQSKSFWSKKIEGFSLKLSAVKIDDEKAMRIGRLYQKPKDMQMNNPSMPPAGSFSLDVELPGQIQTINPGTVRDSQGLNLKIPADKFEQPFEAEIVSKLSPPKALPLDQATAFDAAALDQLLASSVAAGGADFARRMGGRIYPLVHARIDKKMNVDLSLLWVADDINQLPIDYYGRTDRLLFPELTTNYFDWIELDRVGGEEIAGQGFRTREPFAADELKGPLRIEKQKNGRIAVSLALPRIYDQSAKAAGDPSRVVAVVLVTLPDGKDLEKIIRVGDLQAGGKAVIAE